MSVDVEEEMRKYAFTRAEKYPYQKEMKSQICKADTRLRVTSKPLLTGNHWFERLCNELEKGGDQEREVPDWVFKNSKKGSDTESIPKMTWNIGQKSIFFKVNRNEADKQGSHHLCRLVYVYL